MRLIDADALIEFIDAGHLRHPGELAFSEVDVVNMLNHAPTAYDVDNVVSDLEQLKLDGACECCYIANIAMSAGMEIWVKNTR